MTWLSEQFKRVRDKAFEIFRDISESIWGEGGFLRKRWQGFIDWWKRATESIRDFFSDVGDFFGNIPGFQTGGIVPGPAGSPRLIMAHGGEEVISRGRTRLGGSGGAVVNVFIDGQLIRKIAVDGIRNEFLNAGLGAGAFSPGV